METHGFAAPADAGAIRAAREGRSAFRIWPSGNDHRERWRGGRWIPVAAPGRLIAVVQLGMTGPSAAHPAIFNQIQKTSCHYNLSSSPANGARQKPAEPAAPKI